MSNFSRKDFLKISAVAVGITGLGLTLGRRAFGRLAEARDTRYLLGTFVSLVVVGPDRAVAWAALESAYAVIERQSAIFNYRHPASALGQLNAAGRLTDAPPELLDVLARAEDLRRLSGGAFDVSVLPAVLAASRNQSPAPGGRGRVVVEGRTVSLNDAAHTITLDGIAKGWIVDRAVEDLRANGFANTMVEAGGDLMSSGLTEGETRWRIGIRHPRTGGLLGEIQVSDSALATSGDYQHAYSEDYSRHHIIDPATGASPQAFASVSVLADDCATADALATALMVLDLAAGRALVDSLTGVSALWVTKDQQVHRSTNFPALSAA